MGDIRIFNLKELREKFDTPVFIETGTFKGEAVEYAKQCDTFDEIHSIEIMDSLAEDAKKKFKEHNDITIHHGDSLSVLKEMVPNLKTNVLFWLDAHFPGAEAGEKGHNDDPDDTKRIPLEYEVKLLSERCDEYKDVIIMDDAWLYIDADFEWGSFDNHMEKHGFKVTRDELGAGKGADFIYECFEDTHDIMVYRNHQGYFFLTPKEDNE
jgi:hypothetical protein